MSITVLNQKSFSSATAQVDQAAVKPLPNSRKIYVQGSRPDIQVPMREIRQSDTTTSAGGEKNPPIWVYDTSGPYTDSAIKIDVRSGSVSYTHLDVYKRQVLTPTSCPSTVESSWL